MLKHYKELLSKMTTQELRTEKKRVGVAIADQFREWYGTISNAPSWEVEEYEFNCMKRDAIIAEAKIRIAEGRI